MVLNLKKPLLASCIFNSVYTIPEKRYKKASTHVVGDNIYISVPRFSSSLPGKTPATVFLGVRATLTRCGILSLTRFGVHKNTKLTENSYTHGSVILKQLEKIPQGNHNLRESQK
jgi:hypothetical protein